MKSSFLLFLALSLITISFGANNLTSKPAVKASDVLIPVSNTGKKISLLDLSRISVKDFQEYTGKKMSLFDKISFKAGQRQLKNSINSDGTINAKKITKQLNKGGDVTSGFHLGGFALGFLLSLIGVLIAYLINDDLKPSRVKWAWIGAAISLVLWVVIAAI